MNKRKSVLELARKSNDAPENESAEYKRLRMPIESLTNYFEIYDMDNGTIHLRVFSMLYLSQKHYTYREICETLHIGKNTLVRYSAKYEELALKVIKR